MDKDIDEIFVPADMFSVNLCDSCEWQYPECPDSNQKIFGNGTGGDNICCCSGYQPIYVKSNYP